MKFLRVIMAIKKLKNLFYMLYDDGKELCNLIMVVNSYQHDLLKRNTNIEWYHNRNFCATAFGHF